MPEPADLLVRRDDAIERRLGPEVLVVRGGHHDVHRLSGPAALVWEALERPGTVTDLVTRLGAAAPPGTDVAAIVDAGVTLLADHGLVEVGESPDEAAAP